MPNNVLGPEWGNLAGLPAEQALKYVAQYAADLEKKANAKPASRGGESVEEDAKPDSLEIARNMNIQQRAPLSTEFVGRRESARMQARIEVEKLGYDWNSVAATVESAMSGTTAEQQVDPRSWIAAFTFAHGQADFARRMNPPAREEEHPVSPPRNEYDEDVVVVGGMNADRGRGPVATDKRPKIDDPVERRTKQQFEKLIGPIADAEWVALQDPHLIKTEEDWKAFQEQQKKGGR